MNMKFILNYESFFELDYLTMVLVLKQNDPSVSYFLAPVLKTAASETCSVFIL